MQQPILFSLLNTSSFGGVPAPWMSGLPLGQLDSFTPRWYINPGSGTGANTGKSPADAFNNASTAWADAIAASAPGDEFYVNSTSNCSNASFQTLGFKGTAALPNRVWSCTFGNNPPTLADLAFGAQFTTTGSNSITVSGSFYINGVVFNNGTGAGATTFTSTGIEGIYDNCIINLLSTGNNQIIIGGNTNTRTIFNNTPVLNNGGNIATTIQLFTPFYWRNTPNALQGSAAYAALITFEPIHGGLCILDNVDFVGSTGLAGGNSLFSSQGDNFCGQVVNCKINSGVLIGRPQGPGSIIDQIVSDNSATGYKQQRDMYQGTLIASTTRYNNASDGTTPISWQVQTTANCNPQSPFECFMIPMWVAAGTYAASKIFLTSTNAGLKTNDAWVDFDYLGANYALGSWGTTFGAGSALVSLPQFPAGSKPAALTPAGTPWAVGSQGSDYELDIPSFTTSAPGIVRFFVKIGKPSILVNVDGAVTVA